MQKELPANRKTGKLRRHDWTEATWAATLATLAAFFALWRR